MCWCGLCVSLQAVFVLCLCCNVLCCVVICVGCDYYSSVCSHGGSYLLLCCLISLNLPI